MKHALLIILALGIGQSAVAQQTDTPPQTDLVSVQSKGLDVREVITDLFGQAKKSFIMDSKIRSVLYLNLSKIPFDEALPLICKTASLEYNLQNGIYYILPSNGARQVIRTIEPRGKLPASAMLKSVKLTLTKTDLRGIFEEISRQTGIKITVDSDVPRYKLDAVLSKTTLKSVLTQIADATDLQFKLTDEMSIQISNKANRISVVKEAGQ